MQMASSAAMPPALLTTQLGDQRPLATGKVRDIYTAGAKELLFIATDRISAFDCVLGSGVPDKGRILTQLSLFWFDYLRQLVPNHVLSARVDDLPPAFAAYADQLVGRSMLVRRAKMFPVECVARGYLSGSGWKDYLATGALCGIALPPGLRESEQLAEPIFTPAAKNHSGHDENISFDDTVARIGPQAAEELRSLTLAIYRRAGGYALSKGLLLADTKLEFGVVAGEDNLPQILLADEVLTPDSSRYWPAATYSPGGPQPSFDKQYVRDYLESISWNKQVPAPGLPAEVIAQTRAKYLEAFTLLSGRTSLEPEGVVPEGVS